MECMLLFYFIVGKAHKILRISMYLTGKIYLSEIASHHFRRGCFTTGLLNAVEAFGRH